MPDRGKKEEIERLRKHEDELILTGANVFLIAHMLLVMAISTGYLSFNARIPIVCLGIVLSIFWIFIGFRHRALMNWYLDKIIEDKSTSNISQIHAELRNWKEKNFWYRITGHNKGFRATNIRCIWIACAFLIFWVVMAFILN